MLAFRRAVWLCLVAGATALIFMAIRGGHVIFGVGLGLMIAGLAYVLLALMLATSPTPLSRSLPSERGPRPNDNLGIAHPEDDDAAPGWGRPLFLAGVLLALVGFAFQLVQR